MAGKATAATVKICSYPCRGSDNRCPFVERVEDRIAADAAVGGDL
jgi:hypothetical protein